MITSPVLKELKEKLLPTEICMKKSKINPSDKYIQFYNWNEVNYPQCINYAKYGFFQTCIFLYKVRICDSALLGKIRVKKNPYSGIFYAAQDMAEFLWSFTTMDESSWMFTGTFSPNKFYFCLFHFIYWMDWHIVINCKNF